MYGMVHLFIAGIMVKGEPKRSIDRLIIVMLFNKLIDISEESFLRFNRSKEVFNLSIGLWMLYSGKNMLYSFLTEIYRIYVLQILSYSFWKLRT